MFKEFRTSYTITTLVFKHCMQCMPLFTLFWVHSLPFLLFFFSGSHGKCFSFGWGRYCTRRNLYQWRQSPTAQKYWIIGSRASDHHVMYIFSKWNCHHFLLFDANYILGCYFLFQLFTSDFYNLIMKYQFAYLHKTTFLDCF